MDPNRQMIEETHRLVKENNRILHKMRRNAFWGGVIKFVLYIVLLVVIPFWLYATYLAPIMEQMLDTYQQIQGTGAKAEAQFGSFQEMLKQLQGKIPSLQQ